MGDGRWEMRGGEGRAKGADIAADEFTQRKSIDSPKEEGSFYLSIIFPVLKSGSQKSIQRFAKMASFPKHHFNFLCETPIFLI